MYMYVYVYVCMYVCMYVHSRDMKTQKIDILKERLSLFYCNLIQHNFVLNMFSIGQICKENFHQFGDIMDDVTKIWMFVTSKFLIQLFQNFDDLTGHMVYLSGFKQSNEPKVLTYINVKKVCFFQLYFSDSFWL